MAIKLQNNPTIWTLAHDLGARISTDPVTAIKGHCHRQIKQFLREFSDCATLTGLLALSAQKLGIEPELTHDVFGITFRLLNAGKFDLPYISIIDCRGSKNSRAYFTKMNINLVQANK